MSYLIYCAVVLLVDPLKKAKGLHLMPTVTALKISQNYILGKFHYLIEFITVDKICIQSIPSKPTPKLNRIVKFHAFHSKPNVQSTRVSRIVTIEATIEKQE